jgi:hypothetical protein
MSGYLSARQAAFFVAVITCVAFLNSFGGVFVFDDIHEIERNPSMERLFPPWDAMFVGNKLPARPLPYLTFAIDHAIWGKKPFGYHVTNLLIHVTAALALFQLVRLTLLSPRLRDRWGDRAVPLAMVIAMIWAVHPLQTQAVTYIYQRIESLAGMLCLVSLAAFARAAATRGAPGTQWSVRWLVVSIAAAAGAMASKETAVVLPLLILAYDWFFVAPATEAEVPANWGRSLRKRWGFYLALACTWGILALILATQKTQYQEFKEPPHSPLVYALTQTGVILRYLQLAVLPIGQQFDYSGWPLAGSLKDVWPAALAVAALVLATVVGTVRRQSWAWLGVAFLLLLSPTSSVMPIEAVANEHRMYVALAAVVAAVVIATTVLGDWIAASRLTAVREGHGPAIVAGVAVLLLIFATQSRNQLYTSPSKIWLDVLKKDKNSFRAYWTMASAVDAEGDPQLATQMAEEAMRRRPNCSVLSDLAKHHLAIGNTDMAEYYLRFGYNLIRKLLPEYDKPVQILATNLATVLRKRGEMNEMRQLCEEAIAAADAGQPIDRESQLNALLLLAEYWKNNADLNRADEMSASAISLATGIEPDRPDALKAACVRADILLLENRVAEAHAILQEAIRTVRAVRFRSKEQQYFLELFLRMLRDTSRDS